jgi:hypothetical protein
MTYWALVVITIHSGTPIWEPLDVFPTRQACFAALEREQITHDQAGVKRYYRCDAPDRKASVIQFDWSVSRLG